MSDLDDLLQRGVADDIAPGLAAAVLKPGGETFVSSAGVRGLDNPTPLTADTIFYIASCTKPVTSVAALQVVERGLVALDDPVATSSHTSPIRRSSPGSTPPASRSCGLRGRRSRYGIC